MKRFFTLLIISALASVTASYSQQVAVKTNLLGWATTTVNLGAEASVSRRHTLQVFGAINPWNFSNDRHVRMWSVQPEWRHWFCESFNGHFLGIHLLGGEYNIKGVDLPFRTLPDIEDGRHYEGWYIGGGLTYGYQWVLSKHWNIEASVGVGYAYSPYRLYGRCARVLERKNRNYVGPTKAAVSLSYFF